ncbi:AraC family transcriptional regulator [Succinatimonas hippei]|uniref:AraC family transcriptional regulator n=1 Tax=Succinatimonas hippei TaxID=626938 RepID=UPI00248F740C|nr:AraC family transcriptional regulator [Succinatimonas hippei]
MAYKKKLNAQESDAIRKLDYMIELFVNILKVQLCIYDTERKFIKSISDLTDEENPLITDASYREHLLDRAENDKVFVESDFENVIYGGMLIEDRIIIFGPLVVGSRNEEINRLHSLRHNCRLFSIQNCDLITAISLQMMLYSAFYDFYPSLSSVIQSAFLNLKAVEHIDERVSEIVVEQFETNQPLSSLSMETAILKAIGDGDIKTLRHCQDQAYHSRSFASSDPVRAEKIRGFVDISLSARAAIMSGVNEGEALILANSYVREIEDVRSVQEAMALKLQAQLKFAQMVSDLKSDKDSDIGTNIVSSADKSTLKKQRMLTQIKNYIRQNINSRMSLDDLSDYFNVSKTYLQTLFKDQENTTLMRYIRSERIKIAKLMLKTTDLPLVEIAGYLNFCSQSNFTKVFKQLTGMTPECYRLEKSNNAALLVSKDK